MRCDAKWAQYRLQAEPRVPGESTRQSTNSNSREIFSQTSAKFNTGEGSCFASVDMDRGERSYFRSEEMSLCQLFVKSDVVYNCICELGELGLVQFAGPNDDEKIFQSKFAHQMTACAEMDHAIRFLEGELKAAAIPASEMDDDDIPLAPQYKEMAHLRTTLENLEAELSEITNNYDLLQSQHHHLLETSAVLEKADEFFMDASMLAWSDSLTKTLLLDTNHLRTAGPRKDEGPKLGYVTGTIPVERFFTFEGVLWRVCRGNFYIRHAAMSETPVESLKRKFVFIIFFQGAAIRERIHKICQGFQTTLYQCPESSHQRLAMLEDMDSRRKDLQTVLEQTDHHRRRVLEAVANDLPFWRVRVRKVMAVYHVMNRMDMGEGDKHLVAECWIPTADIPLVQRTLYKAALRVGSAVPPIIGQLHSGNRIPPTYNRSNRVLRGFQNLVDSYGIGDYRELNPATYTVVSFPFLFAVMFGDLGHGILMTIFATWLVTKERALGRVRTKNEIWNIIFAGRYIILAMGLFSMYTGSIYNDLFSKSIKLFGTAWTVQLDPRNNFRHFPYPFGVDPVWNASGEAAIITLNSFKMKLAIILGVTQMSFGLVLSAKNHVFFGNYIDLFGMCLPQCIFFSLFVYLVALIWMKWAWYSAVNPPPYDTHCAPSILILFINMLLFKSNDKVPEGCTEFMFRNQFIVQRCLVIVAMLCVPVMLLSKPVYILMRRRRAVSRQKTDKPTTYKFPNGNEDGLQMMPEQQEEESSSSAFSISTDTDTVRTDESGGVELSEVFINEAIHTIEAVLGAVSHTASYLRLWALSLAHDQLSSVLWNMVLRRGLRLKGWEGSVVLCFVFMVWSVLTVAILVVMEGLSAFLHTLRLHWVEFQSKFYRGTGTPFRPFNFEKVSSIDDQED